MLQKRITGYMIAPLFFRFELLRLVHYTVKAKIFSEIFKSPLYRRIRLKKITSECSELTLHLISNITSAYVRENVTGYINHKINLFAWNVRFFCKNKMVVGNKDNVKINSRRSYSRLRVSIWTFSFLTIVALSQSKG